MLLSATPEPEIQRKLEHMKAPFFDLNEGVDTRPQTEVEGNDNWRTVLPPVSLELRRGSTFDAGSKLIGDKESNNTQNFCGRNERTVIILDSLTEVERVAGRLDRWHGKTHDVQTLHGQTKNIGPKIKKFNNSDAAILVTNSAGEIGIDYEADQLIFSGSSASALMQRFGRLRNRSDEVRSIAYVPSRAYAMFENEGFDSNKVTRSDFENCVENGYKNARKPRSFPPSYGAHEAYMQVEGIASQSGPEERDGILEEGIGMIKNQFFEPYGLDFNKSRFTRRHKEMKELRGSLTDFRSSSPSALIYNTQKDQVYTYSIEPILRTGKIDIVEEGEFFSRVPEELEDEARKLSGHTFGYIIHKGDELRELAEQSDDRPTAREITVASSSNVLDMLSEPVEQRIPRKLEYFNYCSRSNDLSDINIGPINTQLKESDSNPVAYAVEGDQFTLNSELGLDEFFFLSTVEGPSDDVCLALSHEAMYLHCIKQENIYQNNPTKSLNVHIPHSMRAKVIEGVDPLPATQT
jgi:hypothetical protein